MYLDFYRLEKEPFRVTPDPDFFFLGPSNREALAAVIYGVERRKGFIVITGEVGMGKTTVLRAYLERKRGSRLRIIYLFNPQLTFPALLKSVCRELGLRPPCHETADLLRHLHRYLIREYRAGRNVLLVIDEAQNMPLETLESVRMLSNLETDNDKLIQIIFSGQPEFTRMLEMHCLRQLNQRVAVRAVIAPFTFGESTAYVRHRLARALAANPGLFTPAALSYIVLRAGGVPRSINILCDNALATAFGNQQQRVNLSVAREVVRDHFGGFFLHSRYLWLFLLLFGMSVLVWLNLRYLQP